METAASVLANLFVMFLAAKLAGELFERIKQPAVIGELLIGIVLGPYALGWIGVPTAGMIDALHGEVAATEVLHAILEVLAELGVIVLLFMVGLETRLSDLLSVGGRASVVAIGGVILPFVLGFGLITLLGYSSIEAMFVGVAMMATSVGITARVLSDLGQITSTEARIILGAAVIDDILAMIALAVVSVVGQGDRVAPGEIVLIAGQALAFTVFVTLVGRHAVRRWSVHLDRLRLRNASFVAAVALMLGLAALSTTVGLAAIIGAFMAGMVVAELPEREDIEHKTMPLYDLFVPLFFVITGSHVDWRLFLDAGIIGIALTVTALAIVGKVVGASAGNVRSGWRSAAIVGVGMTPRGEVGLIVASVGRSIGVVPESIFSIVVIMSLLTTLVVPPVLTVLFGNRTAPRFVQADSQHEEKAAHV